MDWKLWYLELGTSVKFVLPSLIEISEELFQNRHSYLIFIILFYTTAVWGVEILHLKVHKFATKLPCNKTAQTTIWELKQWIVWELWYECWIASQITHCVKLQGGWNTTPCVRLHTQSTFFHVHSGNYYTWLKTFTQPVVVMVWQIWGMGGDADNQQQWWWWQC